MLRGSKVAVIYRLSKASWSSGKMVDDGFSSKTNVRVNPFILTLK